MHHCIYLELPSTGTGVALALMMLPDTFNV